MNTRQSLDRPNEQVSPKRLKSYYEKADSSTSVSVSPVVASYPKQAQQASPAAVDVALLNNLGVDCFEHGVLPDASKCFRNAMSIFAPALPQSLQQEAAAAAQARDAPTVSSFPSPLSAMTARQVSLDPADVQSCSCCDEHQAMEVDEPQDIVVPLSPAANSAAHGTSATTTSGTPRTEYDEGMNSFTHPLRINSNTSTNCCHLIDYQRTAPVLLFNIGQLHALSGDDAQAASYFMYALDIFHQRSTVSSCSCPTVGSHEANSNMIDAIPILHNLGHIYYRAQNYKLAMSMYSKALDIAQQSSSSSSGNSHGHQESSSNIDMLSASASALNCLGVLFFHMSGNSDENASKALEMFTTSLNVRKSLLADSSSSRSNDESRREIATTMNNVGRVYYMLGNHTAALTTYIEAYSLRKELLHENHLDLAASAYNLGQTHHQLGNLDEAMSLYMEFYEIVSKYLGPSHRDVAIILKCMAQVHHDKSEYKEAASLYYESLTTTKAALGEFHPEAASTLNKIGNMYYENSDFDAAIKVYEEGLAVERAVLQSDHQNIVVTLTNIAQSHKHKGNHAAALERYTEAYNLQRTVLGASNPKVAVTLSNVAQVSCRLGHFTRALDAYQEVLQIRRDAHGDNHVDVAATLNSIGLVLFRQGYHNMAIESFEESLRVRRLCLGDQHRDVAVVLYNIATTHLEQGDEDRAMACYDETLKVERSTLGIDHRDLVVTLQHIGQVFRQRGELDVALEYFAEVLRIERLHNGNNSPIVGRVLNKIGNIHLQKADIPKMMECFAEATRIFEADGQGSGAANEDGTAASEGEQHHGVELKITGYNFYSLSIFHPECAAAA